MENDSSTSQPTPIQPTDKIVSWTSTESVVQNRGKKWYLIVTLIFLAALGIGVTLFMVKFIDLFTFITMIILLIVMYTALMISTKLPQKEFSCQLSNQGITINGIHHDFNQYRSFGVRKQSNNLWQLVLIPVKRFSVELVIYIDEADGEKIVDILASHIPMEDVSENTVDKLINILKI